MGALSGGWQKRLALARELAAAPDVLLLDEPTNHLDVDGILWLEEVLAEQARACLVVSHDRYFLEHVATRMLELSPVYPRGLFEADGRYSDFLARRHPGDLAPDGVGERRSLPHSERFPSGAMRHAIDPAE